jgi:hypothetical protein
MQSSIDALTKTVEDVVKVQEPPQQQAPIKSGNVLADQLIQGNHGNVFRSPEMYTVI